jgi:precorrin-6B C5,15-methyltransferase / cobalt-precorrin-6B C5,C15-methyltransferase
VIEVVGIGAAGWESLGANERRLVQDADLVLGGSRHLDLLPGATGQQRIRLPADLRGSLAALIADHQHRRIVVLGSGDPLVYGIGSTLIEIFGVDSVRIHPAVSSVALAATRMGWAAGSYDVVRVRGRELDEVRRHLSPGRQLVILSRDGSTPDLVRQLLTEAGFGHSNITVLAQLGSAAEGRWDQTWPPDPPDLNVVCVACQPDRPSAAWSAAPGLADDIFDHDGQLTKRDVRASAIARLMPVPGQLLWDVGAGAGSIGIEWMRIHPSCRAIAIERDLERAKRIRLNAARLGVPELQVVEGTAPNACRGLPQPDAVFIGGGAVPETIAQCWEALRSGGRLVGHAVTQQTEAILVAFWRRLGGELTRISIESMQPIGSYDGWQPSRPVVQWAAQKPLGG